MLDLSFLKVSVVVIVAFIVLGPKRLIKVAYSLGKFIRNSRRLWRDVEEESEKKLNEIFKDFSDADNQEKKSHEK